ncbi:MAG: lytic murein transglycosylase [Alphaproteobacteria bacterium]|nr:lytic murein transglycosylase [Alphaproteobacteria bacterium]
MRRLSCLAIAIAAAMMPASIPALAQSALYDAQGFQAYLPALRAQALAAGVSRATIDRIFPALSFNARTVQLDQAQPGGTAGSPAIPPFAPYQRDHVTPDLIERGASRYVANRAQLYDIARRYGVSPSVLIAIWGHETSYGAVTGNFDLLDSLASLAYEGRRRQLFADEFIATLKLIDRGIPRSQLKGSWAGATGYPQFLPSVYLRLAVDWDRNGRADIWTSQGDALASIANYLSNAGWKPNVPWGVRVSVPATFDRAALATRLVSPRCSRVHERHTRWLTMGEWRRLGIIPQGSARIDDRELASLIEPDGRGAPDYLLTTNYRAILDYNGSNFYALSVGLLADAIAR